jgi:hypothetical protein
MVVAEYYTRFFKPDRSVQVAPKILTSLHAAANQAGSYTNNININADGSGTVFTVKSADSADACSANTGKVMKRTRVIANTRNDSLCIVVNK